MLHTHTSGAHQMQENQPVETRKSAGVKEQVDTQAAAAGASSHSLHAQLKTSLIQRAVCAAPTIPQKTKLKKRPAAEAMEVPCTTVRSMSKFPFRSKGFLRLRQRSILLRVWWIICVKIRLRDVPSVCLRVLLIASP